METNVVGPTPVPCDTSEVGWCVQHDKRRSEVTSDIATAVLYSLAHNRIDEQKPYLDESLWPFADRWMLDHEAVSDRCAYPWDLDFRGPYGGGGRDNYWYHLTYDCPGVWYELDLKIIVQEVNGRLFVSEFESICEYYSEEEICWQVE